MSVSVLSNNQLSGYSYDAAGNMTHDSTTNLNHTFDAENRITGAAGYTYTYDADGNRVEKSNGSTGTIYWYMSPGVVAESDLSGNLKSEYVFFDGERVARKDFSGGTTSVAYYFSDHLKTASVITNSAGVITQDEDYYPWGGELQFVNSDSNHYKFTGKERDSETGLDYFGARYYGNWYGRFLTPDPKMISKQRKLDPQQWNMYQYSRNNPTAYFDPDGKEVRFADEATAKHAVSDYQARLPESQRGAVGYAARDGGGFKLKVDGKAAAEAGKDSKLAGLQTVAESKRVAEVHYVGGDTPIQYATKTNTDAPVVKTDTLKNENAGGVTLFEQGPSPGSPENNLGLNSVTPGVTEIYVDPLSSVNLMDPGLPWSGPLK